MKNSRRGKARITPFCIVLKVRAFIVLMTSKISQPVSFAKNTPAREYFLKRKGLFYVFAQYIPEPSIRYNTAMFLGLEVSIAVSLSLQVACLYTCKV